MSTNGGPTFEEPDFSAFAGDDEDEEGDVLDEIEAPIEDEPEEAAPRSDPNAVEGGSAAAVLEFVASSLVDDKESVVVNTTTSRGQLRLELHVAPGDMGRVIGRRGRTAQALRTLVRAAAAGERRDAFVDIVD